MNDKQTDRILSVLRRGGWWSLPELGAETGIEVDSLSGQLRNLRNNEGYTINRRRRRGNLHEYNLGSDGPTGDEEQ